VIKAANEITRPGGRRDLAALVACGEPPGAVELVWSWRICAWFRVLNSMRVDGRAGDEHYSREFPLTQP